MSSRITVKGWLPDSQFKNAKAPTIRVFGSVIDKLKRTAKATPSEYCIPEYTPISNQGDAGTCVANAMCDGLEILLGLEHGPEAVVQLSRRHLYWTARATHKSTNVDSGTHLRAAAWQLQEIGVCKEEYFPYSDSLKKLTAAPPVSCYTMASENRVTGHFRITTKGQNRLDDIEQSVRADHPVAFGTAVAQPLMDATGKVVLKPTKNNILGRHAMLVVGVRTAGSRRQFRWRNSWGNYWADFGHIWVDEDFMTWNQTDDLWVLTRMQEID
jgi:C1A family cysteine protease